MTSQIEFDDISYSIMAALIQSSYPDEACGALVGSAGSLSVTVIIPFNNEEKGENRRTGFTVDPLEVYRAEKEASAEGLEIIGYYHSHPDREAIPSYKDRQNMISGSIYIISEVSAEGIKDTKGYFVKEGKETVYECVCIINDQGVYGKEGKA